MAETETAEARAERLKAEARVSMDKRHATELAALKATQGAELTTLMFVQADADAGKTIADAHILTTPKTATLGIGVGVEAADSKYVTLTVPAFTGTNAALWNLICGTLDCRIGAGQLRVKQTEVAAVLDKIEAALP